MAWAPNILATLLFFAVSRTFHLSTSSYPGTFGVEAAEQANATSSEAPALFQQREDPCFDRSSHCSKWSDVGECRKKNARLYMKDNCPFSCNLCNPLLEIWTPRGSNPFTKHTFDSQSSLDFQIFTGVAQKIDFSNSPLKTYPHTSASYERQKPATVFEHDYIASRIRDVLASQSTYLDGIYHDNNIGKDLVSSVDVDKMENIDMELLPLPEKCINRHPYCANWAIKGSCDSRPKRMMSMCAPMCHLCKFNQIRTGKVTLTLPDYVHLSPFQRHDLFGVIDAIQEDRVNVDWSVQIRHVATIKQKFGDTTSTFLDTEGIKKNVLVWNKSKGQTEMLEKFMQSDETGIRQQRIVTMQNFTSPEVCRAILDAVKFGIGLDMKSAKEFRGDDGFPESVLYEIPETDAGGKQIRKVVQNSSTVFLYPTLKNGDNLIFAPSVARLLEKLALFLGVPFSHIEIPVRLEKFTSGELRAPASHMKDALRTSEASQYFQAGIKPLAEYFNTTLTEDTEIVAMENARVFGVTIFLSDVEEGGSVHFPNMANGMLVKPEIGKAILFPTVVSLNGIWSPDATAIDWKYDNDGDLSYLVEDITTLVGHEEVVSGTKYAITVYFRRYEQEELD